MYVAADPLAQGGIECSVDSAIAASTIATPPSMADILAGPPEFTDLTVAAEWTG